MSDLRTDSDSEKQEPKIAVMLSQNQIAHLLNCATNRMISAPRQTERFQIYSGLRVVLAKALNSDNDQ